MRIPGEGCFRELALVLWAEESGLIPCCPKVGETPMIMMDIQCIWQGYGRMEMILALAPTEKRIVGCMGKFCGYLPDAPTKSTEKHVFPRNPQQLWVKQEPPVLSAHTEHCEKPPTEIPSEVL